MQRHLGILGQTLLGLGCLVSRNREGESRPHVALYSIQKPRCLLRPSGSKPIEERPPDVGILRPGVVAYVQLDG